MTKQLLPVGFYDVLFDEAEQNYKNVNQALDVFLKVGFRLIKTPIVEFEGTFEGNYFQTVDVISGKNLAFRNDITPQISRLLHSRLSNSALPLKICYSGDVLCAKSEDLHKDRQQTQVGIEIVGGGPEHELEVISTLLNALQKITSPEQQKALLMEFSLPDFLEIFLEELNLQTTKGIRRAIAGKNISQVRRLAGAHADIITKIMLSNDNVEEVIEEISTHINSLKITSEIAKAQKIFTFLSKHFPDVKACFDLFGDNEFSYHNGIAFDIFCGDFSYPIARGGKYKIDNVDAIGSTIYMNRLRNISI